jgi:hypothetical protein
LTIHHPVFKRRVPFGCIFQGEGICFIYEVGNTMFIFAIFARTTKNGSRSLRFNPLKIATICRQSAFVFSAWFSAQRVISSLCGTILLIFITEAECIYCAVRTEFLNIPQVHLRLSMVNSVTYVNFLCLRIRL